MQTGFLTSNKVKYFLAARKERLQIVDARREEEYLSGHMPGAISMAWEDWCAAPPPQAGITLAKPGYWGVLADPVTCEFADRLSAAGLNSEDPILVYGNGSGTKGREGRVAWMLLYLGAARVYLLRDGWQGWLKSGGLIALEPGCPQRRVFTLNLKENRRITLPQLKSMANKAPVPVMVDTRSHLEFQGYDYDYQPRKGRLPGSRLLPYDHMFDSQGSYLSRKQYLKWLPSEVLDAGSLIAYCEVGVRASSFALMHEVYTGRVVPVFDGSVMEWSFYGKLPVLSDVNGIGVF
jgi:thiosulfate/3-mercaptopyruvate sulfurtransferase